MWASKTTATSRPAVAAGTRVYAIGDSHGCADRLCALHETILNDRGGTPALGPPVARWVVVYLGDYVDRGPDPRGVIDLLLNEPLPGFESVHLMGNHEDLMLGVLAGTHPPTSWMMNGARTTLESYGIDPALALHGEPDRLARTLAARLPTAHLGFLRDLRLSHGEGDYFFVHAGVRPGVALDDQRANDLIWMREPFLTSGADHGKVVVHGHTPSEAPELLANRIGIDTGACYGGRLTALVLEGADRRFLQV